MLSCPRYFKTNFLIKILPPLFQKIWPIMHSGPGRYLFSRYRQNSFNFIDFKFFLFNILGFNDVVFIFINTFPLMLQYDVWITNVRVWLILTKPGQFLFLGPGVWTNCYRHKQSETDRVLESSNHMETCRHKKFQLKING